MKAVLKTTLFLTLLAGLFLGGFFGKDFAAGATPDVRALQRLAGVAPVDERTPIETFRDNYSLIVSRHVRPVDETRLKHMAMSGLVASLGDPHTSYLEPRVNESFRLETRGDYVGVGARLSEDPLGARIVTVFRDGPAFRAGVAPGDVIVSVDGNDVGGMAVDQIVDQIIGQAGTRVRLTVVRSGTEKPLQFEIVRRRISIPTVEHKMLPGQFGYVHVSSFSEPTPLQFAEALRDLDQRNPEGLVIDLRSNPGGLLESAVQMLGLFVSDKPVVSMKQRGGRSADVRTPRGMVKPLSYPVVVLINEQSASAAEIMAGVLRDYGIAVLVGEHTYGKGSVQDLHQLEDGASVKLTIAKYFLPSGEDISRKQDEDGVYLSGGIKPEVEVKFDEREGAVFGEPGKDSQLDRAMQVLREKAGTRL